MKFDHGAVLLSNVSAFVPPHISDTLNAMVNRMNSVGADSIVLCGPLQDNSLTNTLQIPPGYCPTIKELYNMTWALSNTVISIVFVVAFLFICLFVYLFVSHAVFYISRNHLLSTSPSRQNFPMII